jgi:hypothetical protein
MGRQIIRYVSIAVQLWAVVCMLGGIANRGAPLLLWPIWLVSYQLLAFFHEAGHAIAAWAVGWRVIIFTVRPLAWRLRYRDLTWLPLRDADNAGFVSSVPRGPDVASPERYAPLVLAGPLVNLILGAALIWSAMSWLWVYDGPNLKVSLIALGLGIQSLAMGVANLAPVGENDGATLLAYWRGEMAEPGIDALGWLGRISQHGERLRDYPRWMIERIRAIADPPEGVTRAIDGVEIGILLDSVVVDRPKVRQALDQYRATYGASEWLDSCDAWFIAHSEKDALRARARLWLGERSDEMRPMVAAAEAAVAAIEGDGAAARALLADMRAAIKAKLPYSDMTFRDIGQQIEMLIADHAGGRASVAPHPTYA